MDPVSGGDNAPVSFVGAFSAPAGPAQHPQACDASLSLSEQIS